MNNGYCSHQLAVRQIYVLDCASHHKGTSEPVDVLKDLSCLTHDSTLRLNQIECLITNNYHSSNIISKNHF